MADEQFLKEAHRAMLEADRLARARGLTEEEIYREMDDHDSQYWEGAAVMAVQREWIIDVSDLQTVSVTCPSRECQSVLTFDAAKVGKFAWPNKCSVCGNEISWLTEFLQHYNAFYSSAKRHDAKLRLRRDPEDSE